MAILSKPKFKNVPELEVGEYIRVDHYVRDSVNKLFKASGWRTSINTYAFNGKNHINPCIGRVTKLHRLYGHTWKLVYICVCNRAFEERVKTTSVYEIVPIEEVRIYQLSH